MDFSSFLAKEWTPALGCTEPASIALAAATAAKHLGMLPEQVSVICDPRIYKNCYAVGIPRSHGRTGILWAMAIGSMVALPELNLTLFSATTDEHLALAAQILDHGCAHVDVDPNQQQLFIDCTVTAGEHRARAIIEGAHDRITHIEVDGTCVFHADAQATTASSNLRAAAAQLSLSQMIDITRTLSETDRERLREGVRLNMSIAKHGISLFPERFVSLSKNDELSRISTLVCAGVYARMCGEEFTVMTLAGSGNKGITAAVPLALHGESLKLPQERIDEALALACLLTSATTHHLGTLSAVCGCSNAAGIGLAASLVFLEEGGEREISLAINNMVGNVSGMICDGAKIGCALKTMTAVDAAFRASSLALSGIGIPVTDGIVGATGADSLTNLGRIAQQGMISADQEILAIMREKLNKIVS